MKGTAARPFEAVRYNNINKCRAPPPYITVRKIRPHDRKTVGTDPPDFIQSLATGEFGYYITGTTFTPAVAKTVT